MIMNMSHRSLIIFSGCLWVAIGMFLMPTGLFFLTEVISGKSHVVMTDYPLISFLTHHMGSMEYAIILLLACGLFIGSLKAKLVLSKVVLKGVTRILSFPNPTAFTNIYGVKYLILIGGMMMLGMGMKVFQVPKDIRGVIDLAVGSALITAGFAYFRAVQLVPKQP